MLVLVTTASIKISGTECNLDGYFEKNCCIKYWNNFHYKAKQKNVCVSGYMLLKIRVGRSDYFFKQFCLPKALFIKTELLYLHFSVCHVVSRLVVPPFSMANSLISADVLSTAREHYKNTFSKIILNILSCNKNRLETENIFLREAIVKNQK